jgi:hypothetical protein
MLIFLGTLIEGISLKQQELAVVLGKIVSAAENLNLNSFKEIEIENKLYFFGNFEKVIIIVQYDDEEVPPEEFLIGLNKEFINKYSDILENYSNQDIPKFKSFLNIVKGNISKFVQEKPVEQKSEEIPEKSAPVSEPPVVESPKAEEIGNGAILRPMKRDAYPEGIPDYKRDEVLWNESEMVKNEYVAEFVDGMITHLQIFLSISLTHHYEVFIDFSEYPLKPKIKIGEGLSKELGENLDDLLFFYKNWDTKIPPHIIEIIREFESILMKYKVKGKLSETSEMPEAALPDLEPLPELPPFEEEPEEEPSTPEEEDEGKQNNAQ